MSNYIVEYNVSKSEGDWVTGEFWYKVKVNKIMNRKQVIKLLKNKYSDVIRITKFDADLTDALLKLIDKELEKW